MSAVRNTANRSDARKKRALPYARRIANTVLRVLGYKVDDQPDLATDIPQQLTQSPTERTTAYDFSRPQEQSFQATSNQATFGNRALFAQAEHQNFGRAMDPPTSFNVPDTSSVARFLSQKTGAQIDAKVVDSIVNTLQTTPEKAPFKFEFASSSGSSTPNFTPTATPKATPSSSKKLARNPNGTYRWEGAGSTKHARPRNRYASPAFGATPSKPGRLVMKESEAPVEADHKRRKVDEPRPSTSRTTSAESSLPFPITASPTAPRVSVTTPVRPATGSSSSRLRTPTKPTAPVVPSPLRQAWSGVSPGSSSEDLKSSPQPPKPTQTASFMAELIKETTPPKKPDLSNPYQSASPVGKVGPPRRGARRIRATGRPAAPSKEEQAEEEKRKQEEKKRKELEEYSPQAIIEATVPKGSKRSRPPAHFEKPTSETNGAADFDKKYTVEEPEDESNRSPKRSKPTLNGNGRPSTFSEKASTPPPADVDIRIEEIDELRESDQDQDKDTEPTKIVNGNVLTAETAAATTNGTSSRSSFSALKSIPREPSKLRYSFQADLPSSPAPVPTPLSKPTTAPLPKSTPAFVPPPLVPAKSFAAPSGAFSFTFKGNEKETAKAEDKVSEVKFTHQAKPLTKDEIKSHVAHMDVTSLPIFTFVFTAASSLPSSPEDVRARSDVRVLPPMSLPTFDFTKRTSSSGFKFELTPTKASPISNDTLKPTPAPVKGFDFAAAGMKFEPKKDVWTCSICSVSNKISASQCVACENPAPSSAAAPTSTAAEKSKPAAAVVKGFDFAAAGFKMPAAKDTWTCSECFLSNSLSVTKCETCEADRK
ncbi:hypothetical protein BDN70DRAFT_877476 [Pholiota conissans]|uniref:RanBP2-type domain-containing protein n=1 Tax=Pholiota conissans TaxID=109636 RepID=A0A9P5Z6U6_9AGAR|nr:hypothetical protein BDN70DRAFT_877476 [Pholiota conissans]